MDRIKLEGMEFSGYHGCLPVEKEVAQRFLVDVSLSFSFLTAGREDDPAATDSYSSSDYKVQEEVFPSCDGMDGSHTSSIFPVVYPTREYCTYFLFFVEVYESKGSRYHLAQDVREIIANLLQ